MKNLESISLKVQNEQLLILDQQLLPDQEKWVLVESPTHMIDIIKKLKVRGAPLIGVAAAMSLAMWCEESTTIDEYKQTAEALRASRPTAVNLMNALDRMIEVAEQSQMSLSMIRELAVTIFEEDVELCLKMARAGEPLIQDGDNILTHCNTGGLATVGVGTALGLITHAHSQGKKIHVYVDETRPLLQGGRLTTWELQKHGVPYTLICDNMSGKLMSEGKVSKVFLGSDRIALNGDFANKIGTYNLAVLCNYHKVPFYTVAPRTTIDANCESGAQIPVEMRKDEEVRGVFGTFGDIRWAPKEAPTFNPAFDVTPRELLTGMVVDDQYIPNEKLAQGELKNFI
ncbi:MAG: S-methyl-5-thioribose-1-phosphate isomerase [Bdellovibrionales bacterium]|nr:S-methyl-5-thioribose-1-phosphate isomerase [Bdellovibrionales bacterium]NQZ17938.1 S-methyl-5-thioribose-1-phosphate isomerase [Bdellovibrionales bacterium]